MSEGDPSPPILSSDAERERSIAQLTDAVVAGRLTLDEFTDRVGHAQVARTGADLAVLARDLPAPPPAATVDPSARFSAICSRVVRAGAWELPERSRFRSLFGTIDIDLRQATLSAAESEIAVRNTFGTVTVIVPEGVAVSVQGGAPLASQVVEPPSQPPVPDAPRLRITLSGIGGTLYVRSQPPATGLAKLREKLGGSPA